MTILSKELDDKEIYNAIANKFKHTHLVDEVCGIHGCQMTQFESHRPFCAECGKERIEKQQAEIVEKAQESSYLARTVKVLDNHSILADFTLKDVSLESYKVTDPETRQAKEKVNELLQRYMDGEVFNTILSGKFGAGKSHLAMSMIKYINENSKPFKQCLFVDLDEVLRKIKEGFSGRTPNDYEFTESKVVDRLRNADFLVIDDIGAEVGHINTESRSSDFNTKVINAITNGRQNKPTIYTTNLNGKQIREIYGGRIASRIFKNSTGSVIKFETTKDKRVAKEVAE